MTTFRLGLDGRESRWPAGCSNSSEEVEMLLYLPIAILTTLSTITVSDTVPKFDIAKECRFEGGETVVYDRCSRDEAAALENLQTEWPQFADADRSACFIEATTAGFTSYVDLVTCLEMARDVRNAEPNPHGALAKRSTRPSQPEVNVIDKPD
jgi:hypothetical protein